MHYYKFNIGDYSSHTRGLSLLEDIAYRRLIDEYFLSERPFNGCSADVARLIGMIDHQSSVDYVLGRFFQPEGETFVHNRIEKDIKAFKTKLENAIKAGKASGEARKNTENLTGVKRLLSERSTTVEPTNNHKPITNNQIKDNNTMSDKSDAAKPPKQKKRTQYPDDFMPNDSGKAEAQDAGINLATELAAFRNHHTAKGNTMLDWQAAWRTWVGNAVKFGGGRKPTAPAQSIYTAA